MSPSKKQGLPPGWAWTTLASITTEHIAQSGPGDVESFAYVDIASIDNRTKRIVSPKTLPRELAPSRARQVLRRGDVVVSMTRPKLNAVALVPSELDNSVGSTGFHVLRAVGGVLPEWLFYAAQSREFVVAMMREVQGVLYPAVRPRDIRAWVLPLPPVREQVRIVDALDELFSDLDSGVAALERVRDRLKLYRASVLKAAVQGVLTESWRAKHPSTACASELLERMLAEHRQRWETEQLAKSKARGQRAPKNWKAKYKRPIASNISDLPPLPPSWRWVSLDQLADVVGGVTKGQKRASNVPIRDVPYLRVANVQRGHLNLADIKTIAATEADIDALRLLPGDILFNEGGDRDKLGRGWIWQGEIHECIHQNHVFRARLRSRDIQPKFVSWCGNSYGQQWFMTAGRQSVNLASINLTVLRSFPVPLPPAAEQEVVVDLVEDQLSVIDHLEAEIDAKLKSVYSVRQSILHRAFTGQLVPQDPNDEPASELLRRIAAEREVCRNSARPHTATRRARRPSPSQRK